jgi:hypothetical protein
MTATVLLFLPVAIFVGIVVMGFVLTERGWWYLGGAIVASFVLSPRHVRF